MADTEPECEIEADAGPSEVVTTFGPMTARELATAREMVTQYLAISRSRQ